MAVTIPFSYLDKVNAGELSTSTQQQAQVDIDAFNRGLIAPTSYKWLMAAGLVVVVALIVWLIFFK